MFCSCSSGGKLHVALSSTATLSLWSTIKHCTLAADVNEWLTLTLDKGGRRSLWKTYSTSGGYIITPLKTLITGTETFSK